MTQSIRHLKQAFGKIVGFFPQVSELLPLTMGSIDFRYQAESGVDTLRRKFQAWISDFSD